MLSDPFGTPGRDNNQSYALFGDHLDNGLGRLMDDVGDLVLMVADYGRGRVTRTAPIHV